MRNIVTTLALCSMLTLTAPLSRAGDAVDKARREAEGMVERGLYRQAWDVYEKLLLNKANPARDTVADLAEALTLIEPLGRADQAESLLERLQAERGDDWRIAAAVARALAFDLPHDGYILDGEFRRFDGERGGAYANAMERDRARALILMIEAEKRLFARNRKVDADDAADFYETFASITALGRQNADAWRLTRLTPVDPLPDYDEGHYGWRRQSRGAPVDAEGNPVFHSLPASWEKAENDGQRWRWLLGRLAATGGGRGRDQADWLYAVFLHGQFGVQTMAGGWSGGRTGAAMVGEDSGPFAVRALAEDETIARLAGGIKRFALPQGQNFIATLRGLSSGGGLHARDADRLLARIFENRQQYDKALSFWRRLPEPADDSEASEAIRRIAGNAGSLEPTADQPAGARAKLPYVFRNGHSVKMTAYRLDERAFLQHIRDALKDGRGFNKHGDISPEAIGRIAAESGMKRFVAEKAAEWAVPLEPLEGHYSRRLFIDMPFDQAGAYLVEAKMEGGNLSRVVLWQSDLALVAKTLGDTQLYYVADAITGMPAAKATVSFFGYAVDHDRRGPGAKPRITTKAFAELTDGDGLLMLPNRRFDNMSWLTVAETVDKRLAYLGFSSVWDLNYDDRPDQDVVIYAITDRPVYRPGQTIHYKAWLDRRSYAADSPGVPAGTPVKVAARNPMGEIVGEKTLAADAHGGVDGSLELGADAPLGMYHIAVETGDRFGGASFRLEEYKKPEFEVTVDTKGDTLPLGDAVQVKVAAKYYFGSPVADAKVAYRVVRTVHSPELFPPAPWDWLYGRGYGLKTYDYGWLSGMRSGADKVFMPGRIAYSPPEVVAEGEGELDADGVFRFTLDTAAAKALYGDQDHMYAVTAEITDRSRRTIVGSGSLVAARSPFAVNVWPDRGFYMAGADINVSFQASSALGNGVKANGEATLYRLKYDAKGNGSETKTDAWTLATDADGHAKLRLKAGSPGQYRLSCIFKDEKGNAEEGSAVFTIRGDSENPGDFRYTDLELVPDRREYAPGDTLKLAVNSGNKKAVVLLFPKTGSWNARSSGGNDKPIVLRLDGGSTIHTDTVMPDDQPNFFCEALTVFGGKLHGEVREIFVPPAQKVLNVEVVPDAESYAPGAKAGFQVKVTDENGKPAAGQCVVALYDKAVEHISGGSYVGDIREAFWNWKRHYNPNNRASTNRHGYAANRPGERQWQPIGVFGWREMDWNEEMSADAGNGYGGEMVLYEAEAPVAAMDMAVPASPPRMRSMAAKAAPPPPPAPKPEQAMATGGGTPAMAEPTVRREFADTALWLAALEVDASGKASFGLDMPDNLTTWKARVWAKATAARVGENTAEVVTRKNMVVRPQMPRFLTQTDRVILSANVHNYLPRAKKARVELILEGGLLEPADGVKTTRELDLAAGGEARVDWLVRAARSGEATVVMRVLTDEESDAAEQKLPIIVHGARRVENLGAVIRPDRANAVLTVSVPNDRLADRSLLTVSFSPTLASAMLDALPYLAEYPYGCTEQTLNRFLPAVMARNYLEKLGLSLADAQKGKIPDAKSAEWLRKFGDARKNRADNPALDDAVLADMVKQGVERLTNMQNSDGGWGWFSGSGERSWPHTTAVVVHGLLAARDNGVAVVPSTLEDGVAWLRRHQADQIKALRKYGETSGKDGRARADNQDAFIYMVLARQGYFNPDMRDFLYRDRLGLSLSGLAMFGIALHREKATNALNMVLANLGEFVEKNSENQTAWLRLPKSGWWWWYNDDVETQAWYLKLLARTDPKGETTAMIAKYLLENRKNGSYWRSTRDTAYALESLVDFALASGEASPDMRVRLFYDGKQVMERSIGPDNILDDFTFSLEGLAVEEGKHDIRIERDGGGALYVSGKLDIFSLEDPIPAAGRDLKVSRMYYRLVRENGAGVAETARGGAVEIGAEKYRREPIPSPFSPGEARTPLAGGDLVEVELTIEAANDYEYLVFEDMKAAGLEAVELTSGYTRNNLGAYVEYRDQKVVLFVRHMPRGKYNLSYRFRAETPGAFSALPVFGGGMYATDLFANSEEMKVRIAEKGVFE